MITLKYFVFNSFQVNTYLLTDETGTGIIIDPSFETETEYAQLKAYLKEKKIKLTAVVNTHGHVDHLLGVSRMVKDLKIPFKMHRNEELLLSSARITAEMFGLAFDETPVINQYIDESDRIEIGKHTLQVMHIPGHSPGGLAFYSAADKFVIVGDILFRSSIGRTDLPGGDYDSLISGIKQKLLTLPPETNVYSGHGPSTTIGAEHDTNPFLI
ncbi:MAG: MBL fold metallo-hydrolase [Bacteroidota bacterium]|nr:MAG: MBL fold metallo-hydrolase [Bacteroidota bacterium]